VRPHRPFETLAVSCAVFDRYHILSPRNLRTSSEGSMGRERGHTTTRYEPLVRRTSTPKQAALAVRSGLVAVGFILVRTVIRCAAIECAAATVRAP